MAACWVEAIKHFLESLLGLKSEPHDLTFLQISIRALIIFVASVIIVRIGHKRFMAKKTAMDMILAFTLASVLARAINGSGPFFASIACGFLLVILHRMLSAAAFRFPLIARWMKGHYNEVVVEGRLIGESMRKHRVTKEDILEDMRVEIQCEDLAKVEKATLERDGKISFLMRETPDGKA